MNWKNILMAGVLGTLMAVGGWGCSAVDEYVEGRKAAREEKAEKAKREAEEVARARAEKEKQEQREKWGREDTVRGEIPLYVSNPSAWFHETDEILQDIRARLVAAISEIDRMMARYEFETREAKLRMEGYPQLVRDMESALATDTWPVAVDRFYLKDRADCNKAIRLLEAQAETSRTNTIISSAMLNGLRDYSERGQTRLEEFDRSYQVFRERWDMYRARKLNHATYEMAKEVADAVAVTERFLTEWKEGRLTD